MKVIVATSVTQALRQGLLHLLSQGQRSESRNGPVYVAPTPVTTVTLFPERRVLTVPERGDNPFFHLVESLWMLSGRNDLAPLTAIVPRMASFSDDGGKTQPGAYGHRWRKAFAYDQLDWAVKRLKADPNDRRVVIGMWDPTRQGDALAADEGSKDVPCNTQIYLLIRDGKLELTVTCRSNDAIWGAHGANAVHFSVLAEYLAAHIGVGLGPMYQVSNNYHAYEATFTEELKEWAGYEGQPDLYDKHPGLFTSYPLVDSWLPVEHWDEDLEMWWRDPSKVGLRHSFFRRTATPVLMAHRAFSKRSDPDRIETALEIIRQMPKGQDWRTACETWLLRRHREGDSK